MPARQKTKVADLFQFLRDLEICISPSLRPAKDLDGLENVRERRHIPSGLDKSLEALDKDVMLHQAVGEAYCVGLLYLKRDEFKRLLNKSVDEIRDFYLSFV